MKNVTRRDFLKWSLGGVGFAAAMSAPVVYGLSRPDESAAAADVPAGKKTRRAWAMVIDLKKCDGCVTIGQPPQCTQACINGHFVPAGQEWIQVFQVPLPGKGVSFMPMPCNQCENAPCVNVCPVAATYHNEDGIVLVDHKRCIGCRMCMAACPYQRRFFNWGDAKLPPEAALSQYSPEYPVPAVKGTVIKCMFCAHQLRNGKLPLCVSGCPMKAIYIGDLNEDVASNGGEVVQMSRFLAENDGFRYKESLGTQPRVWYLPGHGQAVGKKAHDPRQYKQPTWNWGGFDDKTGVFPWGEEVQ